MNENISAAVHLSCREVCAQYIINVIVPKMCSHLSQIKCHRHFIGLFDVAVTTQLPKYKPSFSAIVAYSYWKPTYVWCEIKL